MDRCDIRLVGQIVNCFLKASKARKEPLLHLGVLRKLSCRLRPMARKARRVSQHLGGGAYNRARPVQVAGSYAMKGFVRIDID